MNSRKRAAFALFLFAGAAQPAGLEWPPVSNVTRPWTRWWWMGSIGTEKDLTAEMEKYVRAGIGGLEITPIYGVRGKESQFRQYLTPEWLQIFRHSLKEGKRLGLGIDMATGNGWPFGGPWVSPDDACKYVVHKSWTLATGESLNELVRFEQQPLVRALGGRPNIASLKDPIAANPNLQALAPEQIRYPKPLPLVVLMAYPESGAPVELTKNVDASGRLNWKAPGGKWTLYAAFQGWHGKLVERAGPGGEGDVIDHFNRRALANYLSRFDEALKGEDLSGLRAWFNDSYEVDDAAGESNWTPQFFEEFRRRRGYDLRLHLPALFGKDTPEKNLRVQCDYRETISDLLLDEFTAPWHRWALGKGATTRNQSHGSPANILDLYAASGIPETEGEDVLRFKFASSAANVTGKRLASAEAATWLAEHFTATLGDVKRAVDLFFLGGINHICYHGTNFSPESEPWPGWMFYASVHFGPTNSFWDDFPILNQYVTRSQSFLQDGAPANDVLVYFNIYDRWSDPGRTTLQHFPGGGIGTTARTAAQELLAAGYSLDFISDRQLGAVTYSGGSLRTGGAAYKTVLLPETQYIPPATFQRIADLARAGATVVIHKALPGDVSGWSDLAGRRAAYERLKASLRFTGEGVRSAAVGRGRVLLGADLRQLLAAAAVPRETMADRELQYVRRKLAGGYAYFVVNAGKTAHDAWTPLATTAKSAGLFDPMHGRLGVAATRPAQGGGTEVYLQLAPGESAIVRTYDTAATGSAYAYWKPAGAPAPLGGVWSVQFLQGGPELPAARQLTQLGTWEDRRFSGTARYAIAFNRPSGNAQAWRLNLGKVADSARVRLNGAEIAGLIDAPFEITIPAGALRASNQLEIDVSNRMANRMIDLDRRGVDYRIFYNINFPSRLPANRGPNGLFTTAKWEPLEAGLLGPVQLTPLAPAF